MNDVAPPRSALPLLSGFSEIAGNYDLILCDVWGVIHNGLSAFPAACHALEQVRATGASVFLVSNAPRPNAFVMAMLDGMGVPRTAYDGIVTSGDVTRSVLADRPGARMFHLGPARDLGTYEGLDLVHTPLGEAELVVCTGLLNDDVETPDDYRPMLEQMRARDLAFVCANPDIVVERGDRLIYCAGAIAQLYDELGGSSLYCGKPHPPIYAEALKRTLTVRDSVPVPSRILAIGDALRTDVTGAAGAGFDSLFISSGIHAIELRSEHGAPPDMELVEQLFAAGPRPNAVMPRLSW